MVQEQIAMALIVAGVAGVTDENRAAIVAGIMQMISAVQQFVFRAERDMVHGGTANQQQTDA
jgi:hypothetical protein